MKNLRRSMVGGTTLSFLLCVSAIGCLKSVPTFHISSRMDEHRVERNHEVIEPPAIRTLTVPPQPRDKRGNLVCTKDRYVKDEQQTGAVSWYGNEFHGRITASGEVFDENAFTLAHLTLPMGTEVLVENPQNGKKIRARVTDCGPFVVGRIADLSKGLAKKLGYMESRHTEAIISVL